MTMTMMMTVAMVVARHAHPLLSVFLYALSLFLSMCSLSIRRETLSVGTIERTTQKRIRRKKCVFHRYICMFV